MVLKGNLRRTRVALASRRTRVADQLGTCDSQERQQTTFNFLSKFFNSSYVSKSLSRPRRGLVANFLSQILKILDPVESHVGTSMKFPGIPSSLA